MQIVKQLAQWFIQPLINKRIHRSDVYEYNGVSLHIPSGVFHPKYFFSTKYLLQTILSLPIQNKRLLELGAGSGLISLSAAKAGAMVTASDISATAIAALHINAVANGVSIEIIKSDLFEAIPLHNFDFIVINPPYYPKNPRNEFELAWYCGEGFEYYHRLFPQLKIRNSVNSLVLMILADGCDIEMIKSIGKQNGMLMELYAQKKVWWEQQYIFSIIKT